VRNSRSVINPFGLFFDIVNIPATAHFIGGCPIGDSPATGVVDAYQRVYGYPGLHVIDGSTISANLGANPALTITAQSEPAIALWPNKGEQDSKEGQLLSGVSMNGVHRGPEPAARSTTALLRGGRPGGPDV
jgi:hypothetical protein